MSVYAFRSYDIIYIQAPRTWTKPSISYSELNYSSKSQRFSPPTTGGASEVPFWRGRWWEGKLAISWPTSMRALVTAMMANVSYRLWKSQRYCSIRVDRFTRLDPIGPSPAQSTITIQVRYRKDPHMQNSMRKLKLTLTLVLILTDTGGAVLTLMLGYRSLYITWQ